MSEYHRRTENLRRAAEARKRVVLPAPCWRCGQMIQPGQPFDMGHVVEVARGGGGGPLLPEHRGCNRSSGGRLGARRANANRRAGQASAAAAAGRATEGKGRAASGSGSGSEAPTRRQKREEFPSW